MLAVGEHRAGSRSGVGRGHARARVRPHASRATKHWMTGWTWRWCGVGCARAVSGIGGAILATSLGSGREKEDRNRMERRPIGVTLLAVGAALAGLYEIWRAVVYMGWANFSFVGKTVSFNEPQWGQVLWALIIAAIWFWVATGFWNVRAYAWSFGNFISLFTLIWEFSPSCSAPRSRLRPSVAARRWHLPVPQLPGRPATFRREGDVAADPRTTSSDGAGAGGERRGRSGDERPGPGGPAPRGDAPAGGSRRPATHAARAAQRGRLDRELIRISVPFISYERRGRPASPVGLST